MRNKVLSITLAALAVGVPTALAAPGAPHVKGPDPATPSAHKVPAHPVAFVLRGVVTATDASATTITLTPAARVGNHFAAGALKGLTTFTVKTDANTKFSKAGKGKAAFADVVANDRVVVRYKAPRTATAADLAALVARRVTDQGPRPPKADPPSTTVPTPVG
jgi:hypothetical protein